jgi:hypothetical protein
MGEPHEDDTATALGEAESDDTTLLPPAKDPGTKGFGTNVECRGMRQPRRR